MNINCKIVQLKSKKTGKDFKALEIKVGVYRSLVFPTSAEIEYIEAYLRQEAHKDFVQDGEE